MADIRVRVGQQNAVKVVSSVSGAAGGNAVTATNVIGGIASVSSLYVSGLSTFVGVSTFISDVFISGNLSVGSSAGFSANKLTLQYLNVTGITTSANLRVGFATVSNGFYYNPSYTSGIAYFDSSGLMVSTGATSSAINYTNYILTTDNSGTPTWSNTLEGGSY
jgi:hypothetical protein